jgi:hypothetical protein
MPVEIKELIIKAVINTQPPVTQGANQQSIPQVQLEKLKKEVIGEALNKVKEYLKEQSER